MTFIVCSKDGVESLQQREDVQNRMVASHCVQHIVDKAAMMPPPSDDLPNVFLMDTTEVVPDQNDITVQGIREKSQTPLHLGALARLHHRR